VQVHAAGAAPPPPWQPFADLVPPGGALAGRAESVRQALARRGGLPVGAVPPRVAASVTHLGLAARLLAPAVAAAALGAPERLDLDPGGLWWQDELGGPVPLSVPVQAPGDGGRRAGRGGLVIDELIAPLTETAAGLFPVSLRVLWGNVTSGISSAAGQIAAQRPELAGAAWAAARGFARHPRLSSERVPPGPAFRRSSCCLIYQLTPGPARAVCGDCVLGPS
jgi:hypothetical protein